MYLGKRVGDRLCRNTVRMASHRAHAPKTRNNITNINMETPTSNAFGHALFV